MKKKISDCPELAKEWHPILNGNLNPNNITAGSNEKFWWICNKGHEWKTACSKRTSEKTGCPYCSNHKVCKDNCLATIYPELAKEWHPTLNGNLTPNDIIAGSNKKVWWKCKENHEWQTSPNSKRGCPYCLNQKACKKNCLATTHPEIAKEFHTTLNGNLTPNDVITGSHKKYWWQCNKGHEWQTVCNDRTGPDKTNCPYCANKLVCEDNCLATTHPEIAKEWHPTLNGNLTPNNVIAGSGKRYWWVCSKNHEWKTTCGSRTDNRKTGCPICNESKGEKEVAKILDKLNISYEREFKFENCKHINKLRFDFIININNAKKAIEYHGIQHYRPRNFGSFKNCKNSTFKEIQHRDKIKRDFCESISIPLLEICYKDYDNIEEIIKRFLLI